MIEKNLLNEINAAYSQLEMKQNEIANGLNGAYEIEYGWYNGHYHKDDMGDWRREAYPIPVVGVKGLCDIEISFDKISVSSKLKRTKALEYSYVKILSYDFEVFGVEDYLCDFYKSGMSAKELKANISNSKEEEIGFAFSFPFDVEAGEIVELVRLLSQEGFYY